MTTLKLDSNIEINRTLTASKEMLADPFYNGLCGGFWHPPANTKQVK